MSDPKHPSPAPKGQPEEKAAEKPPAYVPPGAEYEPLSVDVNLSNT